MSLSINAKTYTANGMTANAVMYIGPTKTQTVKDDATLRYVLARPTSTFSGLGRVSAKLVRTLTLTGSLTPNGDMIGELTFATPVGAASADIDTFLNDLGAYLASASFKDLVKKQQVNY